MQCTLYLWLVCNRSNAQPSRHPLFRRKPGGERCYYATAINSFKVQLALLQCVIHHLILWKNSIISHHFIGPAPYLFGSSFIISGSLAATPEVQIPIKLSFGNRPTPCPHHAPRPAAAGGRSRISQRGSICDVIFQSGRLLLLCRPSVISGRRARFRRIT